MDFLKMKILIVDDARVARQIVKNMLEESGFTDIIEAENGDKALELLSKEKVDCVLSDWNMPKMNGLELLRKIRATPGMTALPFIMVTAERMEENIVQAVQEGVSGYIKKPFGGKELQTKIRQALRQE
ncbi:MAG: response regulator [Desulfovibrio sp.]|nr:MAG: response regulator [Desulfovibrio sp.]